MSDETNSLISAHTNSSSFAPAAAEVVSADMSESGNEFATRRPEEEASTEETSGPKSLADLHDEIRVQGQTEHAAKLSHRENIERLASELGEDAEDLHVPSKIAAYSAETILKVMADFGFEIADFRSPAKVSSMLVALEQEAEESEQRELDEVRQSLESEDEEDLDEDGEEESEEPEQEEEQPELEEQSDEEQKPEGERPTRLADLTDAQRAEMNQHVAEVYQRSQQTNDPLYSELVTTALAEPLGVPPENLPKLAQAVEVLQFGAENLMSARVPEIARNAVFEALPAMLEEVLPGAAELFRQAQVANTWHAVLEQDEFKDLGLPRFGTPEFTAAAERIYSANGWLGALDPTDQNGQPLPIAEALRVKATIAARLLAGQRISPKAITQQVADAVQQGKRNAERSTRRVSAGRAIKGGRSTGQLTERKEYLTLMDAYRAGGHGSSFSGE